MGKWMRPEGQRFSQIIQDQPVLALVYFVSSLGMDLKEEGLNLRSQISVIEVQWDPDRLD